MKKKMTMEEEARMKNKGWSFVDDGTGVVIEYMPEKTRKALEKARLEKEKKEKEKNDKN